MRRRNPLIDNATRNVASLRNSGLLWLTAFPMIKRLRRLCERRTYPRALCHARMLTLGPANMAALALGERLHFEAALDVAHT